MVKILCSVFLHLDYEKDNFQITYKIDIPAFKNQMACQQIHNNTFEYLSSEHKQ